MLGRALFYGHWPVLTHILINILYVQKKKVTENKQWAITGDSVSAVYSRSMGFFGGMWRHRIKAVRKIFGDKHGALPSKEK